MSGGGGGGGGGGQLIIGVKKLITHLAPEYQIEEEALRDPPK